MIEISVAQALLILLDKYSKKERPTEQKKLGPSSHLDDESLSESLFLTKTKDHEPDKKIQSPILAKSSVLKEKDLKETKESSDILQLKRLYFCGITNQRDLKILNKYLTDPALASYKVSKELTEDRDLSKEEILHAFQVINNDTSRRYFETHFAYQILLHATNKLSIEDLDAHFQAIFKILKNSMFHEEFRELKLDQYFEEPSKENEEYSEAMRRIKSDKGFSSEQQKKILLLLKISLIGVYSVNQISAPMLDVYMDPDGFFNKKNRGRTEKTNVGTQASYHLGILRKDDPAPYFGAGASDTRIDLLRAVDRTTYNPYSAWAQENFRSSVHPFVNSISGTLLAQLRAIKLLSGRTALRSDKSLLEFNDKEKFSDFLACYCATLLYTMGGHTFNEFMALLSIPEIQDNFQFMEGFDSINMETLFLQQNEKNFDIALTEAIAYNKVILQRAAVRESIREQPHQERKHELKKESSLFVDDKAELPWIECLDDAMTLYKKNKTIKNNEGYRRANLISHCIERLNKEAKTPEERHHANMKALFLAAALLQRGIQKTQGHSLFNKNLSNLAQIVLKKLIPEYIKIPLKDQKPQEITTLVLHQIERILQKNGYKDMDILNEIIKNIKVINSGKNQQVKLDLVMNELDKIEKPFKIPDKKTP